MKKFSLQELFSPSEYKAPNLSPEIKDKIFSSTTRKRVSILNRVKYLIPVGATMVFGFFVLHRMDYIHIGPQLVDVIVEEISVDNGVLLAEEYSFVVNEKSDDFVVDIDVSFPLILPQLEQTSDILDRNDNIEVEVHQQVIDNIVDEEENIVDDLVFFGDNVDYVNEKISDEKLASNTDNRNNIENNKENIGDVMKNNDISLEENMIEESVSSVMPLMESMENNLPDFEVNYAELKEYDDEYIVTMKIVNHGNNYSGEALLLECVNDEGIVIYDSKEFYFEIVNLTKDNSYSFSKSENKDYFGEFDISVANEIYCGIDSNNLVKENNENNNKRLLHIIKDND